MYVCIKLDIDWIVQGGAVQTVSRDINLDLS